MHVNGPKTGACRVANALLRVREPLYQKALRGLRIGDGAPDVPREDDAMADADERAGLPRDIA